MSDIWVSDYMTSEVVSCPADTTLAEVVEELRSNLFSCLVIVDGKFPTGLITERDLISVFADILDEENWEQMLIGNFMSTPPKTVQADLTLVEAVTTMKELGVRHAPVVDVRGELKGILTQTDIIRGFYEEALDSDS